VSDTGTGTSELDPLGLAYIPPPSRVRIGGVDVSAAVRSGHATSAVSTLPVASFTLDLDLLPPDPVDLLGEVTLDRIAGPAHVRRFTGVVVTAHAASDQITIEAVEDAFGCGYPRDAAAALLIELDGLQAGMEAQAERVVQACRDCGAREVRAARDEEERQLLWKGRKSAFGAYGRVSPAYMVMDGVIPRTKLPYVLGRVNAIVAAAGLRVGNVFHAGDGNLHPNILYDPRKPGEEARVVAVGAEILKVCAEVGGSISGEHGIGLEKADYMPFIFSEADLACMHRVKEAFNPTGLCNPGKIFPSNKACVEVGPAYRPHPIEEKGLAQRF